MNRTSWRLVNHQVAGIGRMYSLVAVFMVLVWLCCTSCQLVLQGHERARGSTHDNHQSCVFCTLACWMAPAGSTFLGQTRLHSPMKVHSQIPSVLATTSARASRAPS